ncbi:MAG: D-cysteine desulfhydrase [Planctomycetes bacterium]|nr:D-cysteine desulfhydrase [Planctomycetota bacterium]
MNLAKFPRRRYTEGKTPIEKLSRLTELLGGPDIYVKRDDLLGLTAGGNKTRKLEFVVADALAQGADTLITCGAVQSNHCRITAAAAVKEGMKCRLVLEERVANSYNEKASGNNLLFHLLGVEKMTVMPGDSDMGAAMQKEADEVAAAGGKAYIVPGGASYKVGALGYVSCAEEIQSQMFEMGLKIDHIICPSGSAGTHSGLVVGFWGNNCDVPISGINVRREKAVQENNVYKLVSDTAKYIGLEGEAPRDLVVCYDEYVGEGYSLPTVGMVEAVKLLCRTEGILLDPVYSGKAMAGLLDLVKKGKFGKDDNVLFLHTGGSPAIYTYVDEFLG